MKAISIGTRYEIHDDSLKSYDALPAKTYTVRFAQIVFVNEKVAQKGSKKLSTISTKEYKDIGRA